MKSNFNKHKFRRFLQSLSIKYYKMLTPKELKKRGEYDYECFAICHNLMEKESTSLLISPISKKRYIKSDETQIFIIIEPNQMTIVNHNYSYNIDIWGRPYEKLAHIFDHEVERRREKMEMEIKSNVKHSLTNIYQNLFNDKV